MLDGLQTKIDQVITVVVNGWNWFTNAWRWTWDRLCEKFELLKATILTALGSVALFLYDSIMAGINSMVESVTAIQNQGVVMMNTWQEKFSPVLDIMQKANGILPVAEGLAVIVALLLLWQVAIVYRAIKSFIPTLS